MSVSGIKKVLSSLHRRRRVIESYEWWDYLNYAQKFSVSSLYQFGYDISFVRKTGHSSIVVMHLNDREATVDEDGLIDTNPNIKTRKGSKLL